MRHSHFTSLLLFFCGGSLSLHAALPRPDHVVLVIEENHSYSQIIGNADCPFINSLAAQGVNMTQSYAITHPSQPNYLDLFCGSSFTVKEDECPPEGSPYNVPNLGSLLRDAGFSFIGYSEDLSSSGFMECKDDQKSGYRRKHNPWANFGNLPASTNLPLSAFPSDFSQLPTLSIVVANLANDMHDGTPKQGDKWLKKHMSAYSKWALKHHSLLIVTWDEDNGGENNRIPTIFYGAVVQPTSCDTRIDHFGILRTLCDLYGLQAPGAAAQAQGLTSIFAPESPSAAAN
jgi:hypothetical protein